MRDIAEDSSGARLGIVIREKEKWTSLWCSVRVTHLSESSVFRKIVEARRRIGQVGVLRHTRIGSMILIANMREYM